MIIVVAELQAKPGQAEALEQRLLTLFPNVQQEHGVVNYILHRHALAKERFFFYERYASLAAKEAHMQTPYLHAVLGQVAELLAGPPVVEVYEDVAEILPKCEPAEYAAYAHNGQAVWARTDLQGKQKEYCICWACGKFNPNASDKGCPIICSVLQLAAEHGAVLPVWACPSFSKKA